MEIRKIEADFGHRSVPSSVILAKKKPQELAMLRSLSGMRQSQQNTKLAFQILSTLRYKLVIMDANSANRLSDSHQRKPSLQACGSACSRQSI